MDAYGDTQDGRMLSPSRKSLSFSLNSSGFISECASEPCETMQNSQLLDSATTIHMHSNDIRNVSSSINNQHSQFNQNHHHHYHHINRHQLDESTTLDLGNTSAESDAFLQPSDSFHRPYSKLRDLDLTHGGGSSSVDVGLGLSFMDQSDSFSFELNSGTMCAPSSPAATNREASSSFNETFVHLDLNSYSNDENKCPIESQPVLPSARNDAQSTLTRKPAQVLTPVNDNHQPQYQHCSYSTSIDSVCVLNDLIERVSNSSIDCTQIGSYPAAFLLQLVRFNKSIQSKRHKLGELKTMHQDTEVARQSSSSILVGLSRNFKKRYAFTLIELDETNRRLNKDLNSIHDWCDRLQLFDSSQSIDHCPESVVSMVDIIKTAQPTPLMQSSPRRLQYKAASDLSSESNLMLQQASHLFQQAYEEKDRPPISFQSTRLAKSLVALLLQFQQMSLNPNEQSVKLLKTQITVIRDSLFESNRKLFQRFVEAPLQKYECQVSAFESNTSDGSTLTNESFNATIHNSNNDTLSSDVITGYLHDSTSVHFQIPTITSSSNCSFTSFSSSLPTSIEFINHRNSAESSFESSPHRFGC